MKRFFSIILMLSLFLSLCCYNVFAEGDSNIDNGGGSLGGGTGSSYWNGGDDGVRVTVVRVSDGAMITTPIDLTNIDASDVQINFGKVCKSAYINGRSISATNTNYVFYNPGDALPRIISTSYENSRIEEIRSYFTDKGVINSIANHVGMKYDTLINGDYKLILEPIAYFYYLGVKYAMTATEAALFDELLSGALGSSMGALTHKNLPLAMFLETADLGYPAYTGSTTTSQSNYTIFNQLGIGIVSFKEEEDTVTVGGDSDYEYRTDTDVITAITVNAGSNITPKDAAVVVFSIKGKAYSKSFVCPAGGSQIVWVKWHTPTTPQVISINVSCDSIPSLSQIITANIVEPVENTPPNPGYYDTNKSFTLESTPKYGGCLTAEWSDWSAYWEPKLVLVNGKQVDDGGYVFSKTTYKVSLAIDFDLVPDSRVKTATTWGNDWKMKSGYGVDAECYTSVVAVGNSTDGYTPVQTVNSVFSEFDFKTYNRLLEPDDDSAKTTWRFKKNIYSYYENRVHFTPLWYPDYKNYVVDLLVYDVWTPVGMLYGTVDDNVYILGTCYDDWYIHVVH